MKFGEYLKVSRKTRNISLRELSEEINLSFSYLCDIENGKKPAPNDKALIKMVDCFKFNLQEKSRFFDLAAESKGDKDNDFHIPADIGKYILQNDNVKKTLRNDINNGNDK